MGLALLPEKAGPHWISLFVKRAPCIKIVIIIIIISSSSSIIIIIIRYKR